MDAVDFLMKDYEIRANYLTNHFSRMWTRFNFFLTIESALFAYSLHKDNAQYAWLLAIAGLLLTVIWYLFSTIDNFLVEVYRRQVAHVFNLLETDREALFKTAGLSTTPKGYFSVGIIDKECYCYNPDTQEVETIESNFMQRRYILKFNSVHISVTELGVVFAGLFFLLWIYRFVLCYM